MPDARSPLYDRKVIAPEIVGAVFERQVVLLRERDQVIGQDGNGLFVAGSSVGVRGNLANAH